MNRELVALHERKAELVAAMKAIAEIDDLTAEQEEEFDQKDAEVKKVEAQISRLEKVQAMEKEMGGIVLVRDEQDRNLDKADDPQMQFGSFGEQLQAVYSAAMNRGQNPDPRLIWQAAASGANEAVPSEGGFLVQKDFSTALLGDMHEMGEILSRVNTLNLTTNANGIKLPAVDETSRADGSRWGGVQAYWINEAGTATASKPKFRLMELDLKKLLGIGYATEEMLQDAAVLETIMRQAFLEEITFKVEDSVINGTGSGQCLGILNSGALISVAKESGQAAATFVAANVTNMWNRIPARRRRNAVWLINQDVEPQLWGLTVVAGSGARNVMLYNPPANEGNANTSGSLLGRPVVPVEYCATLGTVGDVILADLSSYVMIDKGGQRAESSIHVRFLYDEQTFRFIYRADGQPALSTPLTPYKGTNTVSPFVALATRS